MSAWESSGKSDEWYTPRYIFDALECEFDMDVASPSDRKYCSVPSKVFVTKSTTFDFWDGFVWCNPPFGGRNSISQWLDAMHQHHNGIALTPDRTSAPWWQKAASEADAILFISGKVKFIRPDGSVGKSPSTGTTLLAYGYKGKEALKTAYRNKIGFLSIMPDLIDRHHQNIINHYDTTRSSRTNSGRIFKNKDSYRKMGRSSP